MAPSPDHSTSPNAVGSARPDAVVVGSGPNGLAAAITLARAGRSVLVLEANDTVGGAARSAALTLDGYVHDVGSAIHPLTVASPFFKTVDWAAHGVHWVQPPAAAAHPLDDGSAAVAWRDIDRTASGLGPDAGPYRKLYGPFVDRFDDLLALTMDPMLGPPTAMVAKGPKAARFGPLLSMPASLVARRFHTPQARALLAGHAAHSVLPLNRPMTAGFGVLLGAAAHAVGWPFPEGGAGEITRALSAEFTNLGGTIHTGHRVETAEDLPDADTVVFALTPRQIARIMGLSRPRQTARFRYGPGVCKVDYVVNTPIPWTAPGVDQAGVVHLGGTFEQVAEAEATVAGGQHARRPFVLLAQHTLFDRTRVPDGSDNHTVWAYCHVPNGSTLNVSATIDAQIERFAPGFRETIVARTVSLPADLEAGNANLVGGDVGGGSYAGLQAVLRPWPSANPYALGRLGGDGPACFIGSASAAPGGAVHGMSGFHAAQAAIGAQDRRSLD